MTSATAILDIGKTNVKLCLLDANGNTVWSRSCPNRVSEDGPYPHYNLDRIWDWLLQSLAAAHQAHAIEGVNVSTHGACAVLIDDQGRLVLPALDYEYTAVETVGEEYAELRPDFASTCSPDLPAGLNLGRQLFWLKRHFPDAFADTAQVLMYPQYWVWRLSGVAVTEVTSLGCHTDLWCPREGCYSDLVDALALRDKFPPTVRATEQVGCITADVAARTGLPVSCKIYAGVHDSNASFARYLASAVARPFSVVSSGTWVVVMADGADLDALDETRDMLANVNVLREPVACARFMGGREFEEICRRTGAAADDSCSEAQVARVVGNGEFVLPAFASGGGPFAERVGELPAETGDGVALATLYLALMIDFELALLRACGDVLFGSTAQKNPLVCRLLAQLRPEQRVLLSGDQTCTVRGAWCLTRPDYPAVSSDERFETARPTTIAGFATYRNRWRARLRV